MPNVEIIGAEPGWREKVNVPLLRKTLEHITEHPEEWDQCSWATRSNCRTACCLAGTAVVLAGHKIDWHDVCCGSEEFAAHVVTDDPLLRETDEVAIPMVAARELNLPLGPAHRLFFPHNSLADLWALAKDYTDGAIEMPEEIAEQHAREHADRMQRALDARRESP